MIQSADCLRNYRVDSSLDRGLRNSLDFMRLCSSGGLTKTLGWHRSHGHLYVVTETQLIPATATQEVLAGECLRLSITSVQRVMS
jgi:hypothetical protein